MTPGVAVAVGVGVDEGVGVGETTTFGGGLVVAKGRYPHPASAVNVSARTIIASRQVDFTGFYQPAGSRVPRWPETARPAAGRGPWFRIRSRNRPRWCRGAGRLRET